MMSLHKTLFTISCISFSLCAMEQQALTRNNTSQITTNNPNVYLIQDLYRKAYNILAHYNSADESALGIITIIKKTDDLKLQNIESEHIEKFAYKQEESIKNKLFSSENPPYHGPHYVAIFFAKIKEYSNHIKKISLTSPTIDQFKQHILNKKVATAIAASISLKLPIYQDKIAAKYKIIDIPNTVAMSYFEELIQEISTIQNITPEIMTTFANLRYDIDENPDQLEKVEKL